MLELLVLARTGFTWLAVMFAVATIVGVMNINLPLALKTIKASLVCVVLEMALDLVFGDVFGTLLAIVQMFVAVMVYRRIRDANEGGWF